MDRSLQTLVAHEAIRQTAARYSQGVDRLDADRMKSAYWPDAIDDHGAYVGDAMVFCDHVVSSHARFDATMHCLMNHAIEVDLEAGTGTGEIYCITYLLRTDESAQRHVDTWWGRYLDRYERRGDEWRIIHRICVHEFTRTGPLEHPMPIASDRYRQGHQDRNRSPRA